MEIKSLFTLISLIIVLLNAKCECQLGFGYKHFLKKSFEEHFGQDYGALKTKYETRLSNYTAQYFAIQQSTGNMLPCTQQIGADIAYLIKYAPNWKLIEARLDEMMISLSILDQRVAAQQLPDGSWGFCAKTVPTILATSVSQVIYAFNNNLSFQYPLLYLSKMGWDNADLLGSKLDGLQISEVNKTGVNKRGELNAIIPGVFQLALNPEMRTWLSQRGGISFSDQFVQNAYTWINSSQLSTGLWGEWYVTPEGLKKSSDLSVSFHLIHYAGPKHIFNWELIFATLQQMYLQQFPYPFGWFEEGQFGQYSTHNDYDVVLILKDGWPFVSNATLKEWFSQQIQATLFYTLNNLLYVHGDEAYFLNCGDSLGDCFYFGISYLDSLGYFATSTFWTEKTFPESHSTCVALKNTLLKYNIEYGIGATALPKLQKYC